MYSTHATDPDELISKENDKVWKLIQEMCLFQVQQIYS